MVFAHLNTAVADYLVQDGFHIIDNFLPLQYFHGLQQVVKAQQEAQCFMPAKIGPAQDKKQQVTIRSDALCWLESPAEDPCTQAYIDALKSLCSILNESLFLGLIDYEAHFAIYQPQQFYKKHIDQFAHNKDRRISCVYYLNDHWQEDWGGELRLYHQSGDLLKVIQPIGNRFIFFNSDMPHEVCTTAQERYSIAAWLKVRSHDFCKLL